MSYLPSRLTASKGKVKGKGHWKYSALWMFGKGSPFAHEVGVETATCRLKVWLANASRRAM
jgi:hypothetical protein